MAWAVKPWRSPDAAVLGNDHHLRGWLEVEPPTHCRAMLFHVELEAVESVAVFVIKVEIPVTDVEAGPTVEPLGKRAGEDGHQVRPHAKAADLR